MPGLPFKEAIQTDNEVFHFESLQNCEFSISGAEKIAQDEASSGKGLLDPCGILIWHQHSYPKITASLIMKERRPGEA